MPPIRKKQNTAIMYDPSTPVEQQIESLHRTIEQLLGQVRSNEIFVQGQKNGGGGGGGSTGFGHLTPMPDLSGINIDHDARYLFVHPLVDDFGNNIVGDLGEAVVIDNR